MVRDGAPGRSGWCGAEYRPWRPLTDSSATRQRRAFGYEPRHLAPAQRSLADAASHMALHMSLDHRPGTCGCLGPLSTGSSPPPAEDNAFRTLS